MRLELYGKIGNCLSELKTICFQGIDNHPLIIVLLVIIQINIMLIGGTLRNESSQDDERRLIESLRDLRE